MKVLFWASLAWVIYTYIGYLAILMVIRMFRSRDIEIDNDFCPKVSLIIAAYNEEKNIGAKLENSLALDYPKEDLEIIVVSDASNDRTDEIVKSFSKSGVMLTRQEKRRGKTAAQNLAVSKANGDILVFSDATTIYKDDAVKKMVRHFIDLRVGCVGGEERFTRSNGDISETAGIFWKYEALIRQKESSVNGMIGVSGCIFAIRKELYRPLEATLIEDFALPLRLVSKDYKVIYEKEAVGYERAAPDIKMELARKARIVAGGINVVAAMKDLLNPVKYPMLSFQLISHKICRWLAPFFMLILLLSNIALIRSGTVYFTTAVLQISFYLLAYTGRFTAGRRHISKVARLAYHFCAVNFAAIHGIFKYLTEEKAPIWQPVR